ncbi:MAG: alkaline phosphatase family protein [Deltaproteobacteria bacterium]|nr:alkaline phosphatase family protein [Deltaproteobacteria bacterium]
MTPESAPSPFPSTRRWWGSVRVALALLALAGGVYWMRRLYVRSWFRDGPPRVVSCRSVDPATPPALLGRLRVVLVDGLSLAAADALPELRSLCDRGLSLDLDVGFPSISLPVQHALWTGAWQQRTGVLFREEGLAKPVVPSLVEVVRAAGGTAIAVAEGYRHLVASFPFAQIVAPARRGELFAPTVMRREVARASASSAALVFVHLLAVDRAGHLHGGASPEYRWAAEAAGRVVGQVAAARRTGETVVVLSDHGHLAEGGHGGLEREVRYVRACAVGAGLPAGTRRAAAIPELATLFAGQLGVPPPPCAEGRTREALLAGAPAPLPPAPPERSAAEWAWLLAPLLLVVPFRRGLRGVRRAGLAALLALPWSLACATGTVWLVYGAPSLSRAYVYPALPGKLLLASLVALPVLGLQLVGLARLGLTIARRALLLALSSLAPGLALLCASGAPWRTPPLDAVWTPWASTALGVGLALLGGLALSALWPLSEGGAPRSGGR